MGVKLIVPTPPAIPAHPRTRIRWSQNYLRNSALAAKLIAASSINEDDLVFDIGAGRGILTETLARSSRRVVALEIDPESVAHLRNRFRDTKNVEVIEADALDFRFPDGPYKTFSNIPFNVTAELIRKLVYSSVRPEAAYLFMQQAAANKYTGFPRETQASLFLKPWYMPHIAYRFQRSDFIPEPGVDVALLALDARCPKLLDEEEARKFRHFVHYGFDRKRANLGKSFKTVFSHLQWKRLAIEYEFDVHSQATDLNFDQWLGVYHYFADLFEQGFVKVPREMNSHQDPGAQPDNVPSRTAVGFTPRWKNRRAHD